MCGRVIQSAGPVRLGIVEGLDVSDSRMGNVPPRPSSLWRTGLRCMRCGPRASPQGETCDGSETITGVTGAYRSAPVPSKPKERRADQYNEGHDQDHCHGPK